MRVLKAGDLIAVERADGWSAIKILAMDEWPDGSSAAHCLIYQPAPAKPSLASLRQAPVLAFHAPIDGGSFGAEWQRLGNETPTAQELSGFVEYLRLTDFPRYLEFTGQDAAQIVGAANQHYAQANALAEQGRRQDAIAEYGRAIELFPLFFEAIDNRAFAEMELGRYDRALQDFERSLQVNPDGTAAFFSRGECLMQLGQLEAAEAVFEQGLARFPEQRDLFAEFLHRVRGLRDAS